MTRVFRVRRESNPHRDVVLRELRPSSGNGNLAASVVLYPLSYASRRRAAKAHTRRKGQHHADERSARLWRSVVHARSAERITEPERPAREKGAVMNEADRIRTCDLPLTRR